MYQRCKVSEGIQVLYKDVWNFDCAVGTCDRRQKTSHVEVQRKVPVWERECVVGVMILLFERESALEWTDVYIYYVQFSLIFVPGETSNDCVCTDTVTLVSFSKYIIRDITQSREDPIGLEVVEFHFWNVSNCRRWSRNARFVARRRQHLAMSWWRVVPVVREWNYSRVKLFESEIIREC